MKRFSAILLALILTLACAAAAETYTFVSYSLMVDGEVLMHEVDGVLCDGDDQPIEDPDTPWPIYFSYDDETMVCAMAAGDTTVGGSYEVISEADGITNMTATMEDDTKLDIEVDATGDLVFLTADNPENGRCLLFEAAD